MPRLTKTKRPKKMDAFLSVYADCGNVHESAAKCGMNHKSHYDWLEKYDWYREEFEAAHATNCAAIEAEIRRRAIQGVDEPVFYRGEVCGTVRKYSDVLLIFRAKAKIPEYRERTETKITGEMTNRNVDVDVDMANEIRDQLLEEQGKKVAAGNLNGNGKPRTS